MRPSLPAGVHSTTSRQPAICAGTASISTVENRGAVPPGIYSPTERIGTGFWMHRTPGAVSTSTCLGIWASWKARMLAAAAAMASFTSCGTSSDASRISSAETSKRSGTKPSISAASSLKASSPPSRTRLTMACTRSLTTGLTSEGRRQSSGHSCLGGLILMSIC